MSLHRAIAKHAPDLQHLIGVIPDLELAERALEEITDGIPLEDKIAADIEEAEDDAKFAERDRIKDELYHVLDDAEWDTGDELAKLMREALDDL